MKKILKRFAWSLLILIVGATACFFFVFCYPRNPAHWLALSPPTEKNARFAANCSQHEWSVSLIRGEARISRHSELIGIMRHSFSFRLPKETGQSYLAERHIHRVPDGWIVGFNDGEFGASVWWFSNNKKSKHKISDAQVVDFVITGTNILVLDGLAHLTMSQGQVLLLNFSTEKQDWKLIPYAPLPEAPYAATSRKDGTVLIVTSSSLISLGSDKIPRVLIKNAFWGSLYPNSIIVDSNDVVYIGMRQGVARIPLKSGPDYKIDWLVPSQRLIDDDNARYNNR